MAMAMCPTALDCTDVYGRLVIDGWSLHTGAWCAHDLSDLFRSGEWKGENVDVSGEPGTAPRARLDAETVYSVPMLFSGAVDRLGVAYADPAGGVHANRRAAEGRWVRPIREGTATLPAQLFVPDGAGGEDEHTAAVQPVGFEDFELLEGGYARAVLAVLIPAGRVEPVYA